MTSFIIFLCAFVTTVNSIPPLFENIPDFGALEDKTPSQIYAIDRLPPSITPQLYHLEIRPILDDGTGTGERFTAPGKICITGMAIQAVESITLNIVQIEINSTSLSVVDADSNASINVIEGAEDTGKQFYTVILASPLTTSRNYTLCMEFISKINTEVPTGLYASVYKAADGSTKYLVSTDFEAPDARMAFPCFDEPSLKAEWQVEIIRQNHYHSLANMDMIASTEVPELPGWTRDTYGKTLPMSSYLVCFAVSDFKFEGASASLYSKPVKIWGPPELMDKGNGKFSPDFSAKLMKFFEEYYGIEYSFPKMDKISIPDFSSGAMENWGLNTYRDTRLLFEEGISTAQDMFSMTNTISHELVHQWWGNLVTCEWWEDLWIQEGAATYYAPIAVAGVGHQDLLPLETLITATVQRSLDFDATLALTHPIHNVGVDPAGSVLFDTLTYHKGASLYRMMNSFLTTPLFNLGMNRFLKEFSYKNANQFQMFDVLDKLVLDNPIGTLPIGVSVTEIMNDWTLKSGFPVITVERDPDPFSNRVTFTQERFFQREEDRIDEDKWFVPLSIYRQSDSAISTRPEKWLLPTDTTTTINSIVGDWFIVNPQTHGYYRVLYTNSLLDNIIEQLLTNHMVFDVQIRSSLVDDNLNLAFAGYLEMSKALNLTTYLTNERELFPWQSFFTNMAHAYRMFARSPNFASFKRYILNLTGPALTAINIEPQPADSNPTILLRTRLVEWRCNMGHEECISFSKNKLALWMSNPNNTSLVFPDLQPSVYCTGIANGGDMEWEFIWAQYLLAERDVMQTNLLRALACSKTSFRLNILLDMAIERNSGVRDKHRAILMQAVAGNSAGVDITFSFLRNNHEAIIRRYGMSLINSAITTLTTQINDPYYIDDLETFAESISFTLSGAQVNNLEKNLNWMTNNHGNFSAFIDTQ